MVAELTPLKAIKCSYDDCYHSFDTDAEKQAHLRDKEIHPFFCGKTPSEDRIKSGFVKCDFHGKCWEDLLTHKVESMMPWLVGDKKDESPKKLSHIVCEFCGLDFSSLSGRNAHRKQMHQAEQHVVCRGYTHVIDVDGHLAKDECGMIFGKASQVVRHIEGGFCAYMRPKMLQEEREHKEILKKILADPDAFKARVETNFIKSNKSVYTFSRDNDGGVTISLSDQDSFSQRSSTPTQSSVNQENFKGISYDFNANWPAFPSSKESVLSESIDKLSINSFDSKTTTSTTGTNPVPPHRRKTQPRFERVIVESDCSSTAPPVSSSKPWAGSESSKSLSGDTKTAQPTQTNWDAAHETHKRTIIEEKAEEEKSNIFYARWYNPNHAEFCPEMFHKPEEDTKVPPFKCPFTGCERRFLSAYEAGDHVRVYHATLRNTCLICCKEFDKLSGLVAHCEASSQGAKCWIARNAGYPRFLYDITGGLLSATKTAKEPICGYRIDSTTPAEKHDPSLTRGSGVKDYDYAAEPPSRPAFTREAFTAW